MSHDVLEEKERSLSGLAASTSYDHENHNPELSNQQVRSLFHTSLKLSLFKLSLLLHLFTFLGKETGSMTWVS